MAVVTAETLDRALDASEKRLAHERELMARLRAGELTLDLLGLRARLPGVG